VRLAPVYPVGKLPPPPQVCAVDMSLIVLLWTKPVPVSCTRHCTVMVHPVAANTSGPFSVNKPTSKEKSVFPAGLWLQQTRYRTPEVPPLISLVATAYTSEGAGVGAVTDVVDAKPVKVFTPTTLAAPQDWPDARMRITLELSKPSPVNCSEHVSVSVQSVAAV
jgi:hypothetical protein